MILFVLAPRYHDAKILLQETASSFSTQISTVKRRIDTQRWLQALLLIVVLL